jgi:hypothetical protein
MVWDDLSTLAITLAACATGTNSTATSAARIITLSFMEIPPLFGAPASFGQLESAKPAVTYQGFPSRREKIKTPAPMVSGHSTGTLAHHGSKWRQAKRDQQSKA